MLRLLAGCLTLASLAFPASAVTYKITAITNGPGFGHVFSSPPGLACPPTCEANFEEGTEVRIVAQASTHSFFGNLGGDGCFALSVNFCLIQMDGDKTNIFATFGQNIYTLNTTKTGSGTGTIVSMYVSVIDCGDICSLTSPATLVTLNAIPGPHSRFVSWNGCETFFTQNPCDVQLISPVVTATARFDLVNYPLGITMGGVGSGTVTSSPGGINCSTPCSGDFQALSQVTLTATPSQHSVFTGWGGACTGTGTCIVTMNAADSVTANFALKDYTLTAGKTGLGTGTITSPAGIDCGVTCAATLTALTSVTLTATAGPLSEFASWTGCDSAVGNQCTLSMDGNRTPSARFKVIDYTLGVTRLGAASGTVTSAPAGISCGATCSAPFEGTTQVTLTATPAQHAVFTGWGGACTGTGACIVTMNGAQAVTATFGVANYTLTAGKSGAGTGSIVSAPAGIDCGATCATTLAALTPVTLTATAGAHSQFAGWSGCDSVVGNQCTLSMNGNRTPTASFTLVNYTLTVTVGGAGTGSVGSSPGSLNCLGLVCSGPFTALSQVTLTATPAAHMTFTGWSGACAGIGACIVTMDAAKSVTATFIVTTHVITAAKAGTGSGRVWTGDLTIDCGDICSITLVEPYPIQLIAYPLDVATGFVSWTGCDSVEAIYYCNVAATADRTVTATFAALTTYEVFPEGWQAAPYVQTQGSGHGTVAYNPGTHAITFDVSFASLSSAVTSIHLHGPAARGANGPVIADLTAVSGHITNTVPLTTQQEAQLLDGKLYFDVRTTAHPGGEIRGQIDALGATVTRILQVSGGSATAGSIVGTSEAGNVLNCPGNCSILVPDGKPVQLVATPSADYFFGSWTNCDSVSGTTCTVSVSVPKRIVSVVFAQGISSTFVLEGWQVPLYVDTPATGTGTALYLPQVHQLRISLSITGLTGTLISADLHGPFGRNQANLVPLATLAVGGETIVPLTPDMEAYFSLGYLYVTVRTTAYPLLGEIRGQIDNLGPAVTHTVTVTKLGSGTVTGYADNMTVVDCGADCTATVPQPRTVQLVATPSAGEVFAGWSGACSGTLGCSFQMTADRTVSASFVPAPPPEASSDLATVLFTSTPTTSVGRDVTFKLTVANYGPDAGDGVATWATIPDGMVFVSSALCNPLMLGQTRTVACVPDTLAVGASMEYSFVLRATRAGTFTVGGDASSARQDKVAGNNHSSLALTVADATRLSNISTRMQVLGGNDVMIAGFIVGGDASKTVVINVAGPNLVQYGITNALLNPKITLVRSSDNTIIGANDDWQTQANPADVAAIIATGFQPNNPAEPAILATLAPGAYTAIVEGVNGTTGVALVGVFEVNHTEIPLTNISTRGQVLTGNDVMIAGFIVQGENSKTVVINVAGPNLVQYGITNALMNPTLTIVRSSDQTIVAQNDDWQTQTNPADVAAIVATGFQPNNPLEPAVLLTLPPGAYTAIVSGKNDSTGVGLVGVFAVP